MDTLDEKDKEIQKYLAQLYCINKIKKEKCSTRDCHYMHCLCLDVEQLMILKAMLGNFESLKLQDENNFKIAYRDKDYDTDLICRNQPDRLGNLLICNSIDEKQTKELVQWLESYMCKCNSHVYGVIKALPVLQMANGLNEIDKRESFPYLCIIGEQAGEFLRLFLQSIILKAIEKASDEAELLKLVTNVEKFLVRLLELRENDHYSECKEIISSAINEYISSFELQDVSLNMVATSLENYYKEFWDTEETWQDIVFIDDEHKNEAAYLFRLFTHLLEMLGCGHIKGSELFQFTIGREIIPHNIFDNLENLLKLADRGNEKQKAAVFSTLKELIENYGSLDKGAVDKSYENLENYFKADN